MQRYFHIRDPKLHYGAGRPAFRGEIIVKFRRSVIGEAHIWAHVVMKAPTAVSGGVVVAAIESSVVRAGLV